MDSTEEDYLDSLEEVNTNKRLVSRIKEDLAYAEGKLRCKLKNFNENKRKYLKLLRKENIHKIFKVIYDHKYDKFFYIKSEGEILVIDKTQIVSLRDLYIDKWTGYLNPFSDPFDPKEDIEEVVNPRELLTHKYKRVRAWAKEHLKSITS